GPWVSCWAPGCVPLETPCRGVPLDFAFVIDSSRSIRPRDYEKVKAFILDLLQFLEVGPDATRVALLQYGSVVQSEFPLNAHASRAEVERAVRAMQHLASGTMTGLALQYTMDTVFTEEQGARPAGLLIPRIAMVVTDGRPQDTVEAVAAEARRAGVQIFAIGVGRVDMKTLQAIGSQPHSEHVYLVANFSRIQTLNAVFQSKLCGEVDHCGDGKHGCEHEAVNMEDSCVCKCRDGFKLRPNGKSCKSEYRDNCFVKGTCHMVSVGNACVCKCRDGFTLGPDGKSCNKCGNAVMDLVFIIDGSKSLGPINFELVKGFVNAVVDSLDVSRNGTRVGLLQYSTKVRTEFTLGRYASAGDVKEAVSRVQYMGRGSMTGMALRHMFQTSFTAKEGARLGVRHATIVLTDGRSQDDVVEWANKAKNAGVTMYALGVGKAIEEELKQIASEPDETHVFYAENFDQMGEITNRLKSGICQGISFRPSYADPCQCDNVVMFQMQATEKMIMLTQDNILFHYKPLCQIV
uniref:Matrilin 2 n=1 Tax=Gadus morhua TaxID=8049 RepID=A0A8C5AMC8_GADMO